jgi:hypothetical protein
VLGDHPADRGALRAAPTCRLKHPQPGPPRCVRIRRAAPATCCCPQQRGAVLLEGRTVNASSAAHSSEQTTAQACLPVGRSRLLGDAARCPRFALACPLLQLSQLAPPPRARQDAGVQWRGFLILGRARRDPLAPGTPVDNGVLPIGDSAGYLSSTSRDTMVVPSMNRRRRANGSVMVAIRTRDVQQPTPIPRLARGGQATEARPATRTSRRERHALEVVHERPGRRCSGLARLLRPVG